MTITSTVHNLFPTPILVTNIPVTQQAVDTFSRFDTREIPPEEKLIWGTTTGNMQVLKTTELSNLRDQILVAGKHYAREVLCYGVDGVIDILSWLSIKAAGQSHRPHMHPNSFISCVYYFDEIDESLPLVFHKHTSTPINTFQLIPPFDREKANRTKSAQEHFPIVPNKGDLIFFPSYLYHSIPLNKTSKKRSAMAVNMMPTNSVGEDLHITTFQYRHGITY